MDKRENETGPTELVEHGRNLRERIAKLQAKARAFGRRRSGFRREEIYG
jgi:hypothetical protein